MIPELGHLALILAFVIALFQATVPLIGAATNNRTLLATARPAAWAQLAAMLVSYAALTWAFLSHDFSVAYVAQHSNLATPTLYLVSGVWGAHEGSLLLWALLLSGWAAVVAALSRSVPDIVIARVLAVMGMSSIGFQLFIILTSNPFDRLLNPPMDGGELNPLLQDPGLAIHPPLLYMGYVGLSVAFAFAIAAMLGGRLDSAWARWSRPWTIVAWLFLTLGIALGSWWAYYELGWGGWWFWDPVENASLLPWLVATALIHSLAVSEKRSTFKAWTVLLAILGFSLSLLGTFLVRSGVLTSVHAFASDPARGIFILGFLVVVIGGSLLLYAWKAPSLVNAGRFKLISRETAMLLGNVVLLVLTASVLLGTLYPLVLDALGVGKISVGPPYFDSVFIPLAIPLTILMGFGVLLRWKQDRLQRLWPAIRLPLIASPLIGVALTVLLAPAVTWQAVLGLSLASWVIMTELRAFKERKGSRPLHAVPRAFWGMMVAHFGIAVFIIGLSMTTQYSTEKDVRLAPGESYEMGGYSFLFKGVEKHNGPNYTGDLGHVVVSRDGKEVADLWPQKRQYRSGMPMTEAAIDDGLFRDLFVALGEPLAGGSWSLRLYHKPFVRWLWLAAIFMAIGGALAASDRRYRLSRKEKKGESAPVVNKAGEGL